MRVWELIQILENVNQESDIVVDKGSHTDYINEKDILIEDDHVILGWEGE